MKVSGFTLIRNGEKFDYPYKESLRSLEPVVDELIINVGRGDDNTLERVRALCEEFNRRCGFEKAKWFESDWKLDDPEKKKSGLILSEQTNLALNKCTGDWCFYLQGDEVISEQDYGLIRGALNRVDTLPEVEGLLFDWVHFYGSYGVVQKSRSAYRREVRLVRRSAKPKSIGDAQSFRKEDGTKLRVMHPGARIFHYGWVRTPEAMKEKTYFMDQLYHGDAGADAELPHTGDNYRYKKFWGLWNYHSTHPSVMWDRIAQKGWNWDLASSPMVFTPKDLKKIVLDGVEILTGLRLFEYRSYRLLPHPKLPSDPAFPRVSLILATYEMPKHLALVFEALKRQSMRDFEVILCDDGSGEETRKIIEEFRSQAPFHIEHIWQEHKGFRKCRMLNEGLRKSRGAVFVFLDGDCVPHRDYIRDHFENQEHGFYLAGRRVELGEEISYELTRRDVRAGFFDYPSLRLILSKGTEHLNRCFRVSCGFLRKLLGMEKIVDLKGCNYSVPRKVLFDLNGFDEAYEGYGREDTDAEIRFQNYGLKIKSLKGLALQFHVWHPRREFTPANEGLLESAKLTKRTRCERGLEVSPHQ
jgi:glycosyltransferase involved in cell wall biosynthesis